MSNKTLAYLLIAIVILASGFFAMWRTNLNKQNKSLGEEVEKQQQDSQNNQEQEVAASDQEQRDTAVDCQRDFSQETLNSAQVEVNGRTVEISVKDFGNIRVELYDKDAPKTVENFLRLVNAGYYDCVTFHRVAKGFVIQSGDPTGTGGGGESAFGGEFEDELNPDTESFKAGYKKGVLAMANRGPNTNTSQFFITLEDISLPNSYTIFGKVTAGQDVVDQIGRVDIIPNPQLGPTDGKPVFPVVIEKATIIK